MAKDKVELWKVFPAFECLLRDRACLYIDAKRLVEAAAYLCRRMSRFEERARAFAEMSEEEIEEFVSTQAKALLGAGARVLDSDDALEVLVHVYGYEQIVRVLKEYEERRNDVDD